MSRSPRFHVRPEGILERAVRFDADEAHHLARVLRLAIGDTVLALDGRGQELTVRLTAVSARGAEGEIVERKAVRTESPLHVTLAQGIPKGNKMEMIIRMATELGVAAVVPLITARTVPREDPGAWAARAARWRRVATEGAKQSGRGVVPDVPTALRLGTWLGALPPGLLVCCWEGADAGLAAQLPPGPLERAVVVIGPEGGLTEEEVSSLSARGAVIARLGPRVLRTETAGPVAIALLQSRYGDIGQAG